jgi:hypothetical protein
MDYAFAPLPDNGNNLFYTIYRRMFPHRPATTLINQAGLTRVKEFLDHVANEPGLDRPVGSFLIASHGNDGGFIQVEIDTVSHIDADGNPIPGTTYEVLSNADNNDTVDIPNALLEPRPAGAPPVAVFHIRGCNVGAAEPFLEEFKAALGGAVEVSAPRLVDNNQEMGRGAFEYLGYHFRIIQRDAFAGRNQLITAFRNAALTFIDGSPVPDASWPAWIPRDIGQGERVTRPFAVFGQQVEDQGRIRLPVRFRHNFPRFTGTYSYTVGGVDANPGNAAARLQLLRDSLDINPLFQAAHAFPEYERRGYGSVQEFVDGYRWVFNWNRPELVCRGTRHVYTVSPPVTNGGNLLFNYYPDDNNAANVVTTLSDLAAAAPQLYQECFRTV